MFEKCCMIKMSLYTQFNQSLAFFKLQLLLLTARISPGQLCPLSHMDREGTVSFLTTPWLCMVTLNLAPLLPPSWASLCCLSLWATFGKLLMKDQTSETFQLCLLCVYVHAASVSQVTDSFKSLGEAKKMKMRFACLKVYIHVTTFAVSYHVISSQLMCTSFHYYHHFTLLLSAVTTRA